MRRPETSSLGPGWLSKWSGPTDLRLGEPLIMILRRHPAVVLIYSIPALAGLIVAGVLYVIAGNNGIVAILIWLASGLLVLNLIFKVVGWWGTYLIATARWMLLVSGTHKFAALRSDQVEPCKFSYLPGGRLFGYGAFEFMGLEDCHPLRVVSGFPSYEFQQILTRMSSDTQQVKVESGEGHMAPSAMALLLRHRQRSIKRQPGAMRSPQ